MKKLIFTFSLSIFFILCLTTKVKAYVLEKNYDRTYNVVGDYVEVSEKKSLNIIQSYWQLPSGSTEAFTIFYPSKDIENSEEKINETIRSIQVTDQNGSALNYALEQVNETTAVLKVSISRPVDINNDFFINLTYKTYGLSTKSGQIIDFYIPAFSQDYKFETDTTRENITTKVIIPKNLGDINFVSSNSAVNDNSDNWEINVEAEKLKGNTTWIQIGTTQFYSFKITQKVLPSSNLPFYSNIYSMPIPRDVAAGPITQEVRYTKISPNFSAVKEDENGNLLAYFKLPANLEDEIVIEGYVILKQNSAIDYKNSGNVADVPQTIIDQATMEGKFWEVNNVQIQEIAKELKGDKTNVFEILDNTYQYVINRIDYSEVKRFGTNERQGALQTLNGGAAVCMEYSDLFITLMRAQGIPARAAFGYGYSPIRSDSEDNKSVNHQWAEVYIPSLDQWVNIDTTWGENGNALIGGDLNHVYFHVASIDPETPSSTDIAFYGSLDNIPERDTQVEVITSLPEGDYKTQVQLLSEYNNEIGNGMNTLIPNIVDYTNYEIDKFIQKAFPQSSGSLRNIIKIAILIIISTVLISIFFRKKISKIFNTKTRRNYTA